MSEWTGRKRLFFIATFLILLGISLTHFIPKSYRPSLLYIKSGSETYQKWKENSNPTYTYITLFNWTNPDKFNDSRIKPGFLEMGPYVFRQRIIKDNIAFHPNETVSYNILRMWFFEPELSNGSLSDVVTAPNVVTATIANMMQNKTKVRKNYINKLINDYGGLLATTQNVSSMIFKGYHDKLLNEIKNISKYEYLEYGYFFRRNYSMKYDGKLMIKTGVNDLKNLGELTHWNKRTHNGFYPGDCGKVNGSAGDLFPPLSTNKGLTIYSIDTCRFLNLSPGQKVNINGLDGFKWIGTDETLDSGLINPNKKCFRSRNIRQTEIPKKGIIDCRKCHNDWPIYASFPHFYLADEQYVNNVKGVKPEKEKHQYSYVLEPESGLPLEIKTRIQMNLLIQNDPDFDIYINVPKSIMMPMYFVEEITEFYVKHEKFTIYTGYFLIALGALMYLICLINCLEVIIWAHAHTGYETL